MPQPIKKILEEIPGLFCSDSVVYFGNMVGLRVLKDACAMQNSPGLWIGSSKQEPCDPGVGNCGCAHRTGFNRNVERMSRQPFRPGSRAGIAQRKDFGMGCRIAQFPHSIASGSDDPPLRVHHHRTNRHLTMRRGNPRLGERSLHLATEADHAFQMHPERGALKVFSSGLSASWCKP